MRDFNTLSEAMGQLKSDGYVYDFNLDKEHIFCQELDLKVQPHEFKVVEYYRFEGDSNPSDNSILYAVETEDGTKGLLVDAYGAYSGEISDKLVQALKIN